MKVALFKSFTLKYQQPWKKPDHAANQDDWCPSGGYLRVSEWIDVDFPPRDADEMNRAEMEILAAEHAKLTAEYNKKVAELAASK